MKSVCFLACALLLAAACVPSATQPIPSTVITATASPVATATATLTMIAPTTTHTPPPLRTATALPTPESLPTSTPTEIDPPAVRPAATSSGTPAATATHTPTPFPPLGCHVLPTGSFLAIWQSDPDLQRTLGCPFDPHPRRVPAAWPVQTAYQRFERGEMIWSDHVGWYPQPVIYVLCADSTYQRMEDTFGPAVDPVGSDETPPRGLLEPAYGFGKAWRDQPGVRERLGWATSPESPGQGHFQMFLNGTMVWISQTDRTYVFVSTSDVAQVLDVPFSDE